MHTPTRSMFGSGTRNSSLDMPPHPSASITTSLARGTVIFTHADP